MHRVPLQPLVAGVVVLPATAARYLVRVLRLRVGDGFEAFDPRAGVVAKAAITAIDRDGGEVRATIDPAALVDVREAPVVIVQGYPKGDKLGDVARDATELGATAIVPALCARSVARPDPLKLVARQERVQSIVDESARQCGRVSAPIVLAPLPWDDALAAAETMATYRFVLWESADVPLRADLLAIDAPQNGVAFAIGPEGGLTAEEAEIARARGWCVRSLGKIILRTETAATAVLGAWRVLGR